MYAVRQRPGGPSKAVGASVAVLVTLLAGYAFATGLVMDMVKKIQEPTTITILDAPEEVKPLPIEPEIKIEENIPVPEAPPLIPIPQEFVPENVVPVMIAPAEPAPVAVGPIAMPGAGSDRVGPKLRAGAKPPYPSQSIRAQEQGVTALEICVGANGRVNSAQLAKSSGHARLDDAALTWVRNARFTPGSIGGVPQSMCGHEVYYEWNLEDAR